jgi:DNA-binding NarL/FixJ family response regulator
MQVRTSEGHAPPLAPARVVLASAGRGLLVDALGVVIEQRPDVDLLTAPVHSLDDAVAACTGPLTPDVLLMDVDGASPSAVIEFLLRVRRSCRSTRIVLLVDPTTEHDVLLVEYVEAGVDGFLHRAGHIDDVLAAIQSAANGETVISRDTFVDLLRRAGSERDAARRAAGLLRTITPREFDILRFIAEGLRNEEIAERLNISVRTVTTHVQNVFRKLEVHSRIQAIALLNRTGVLSELDPRSTR